MNASDVIKKFMDDAVNKPISADTERIRSELDFASKMCAVHPSSATAWKRIIERAVRILEKAIATGDIKGVARAVRDAEGAMAPIGAAAKKYTVHCVGHAHIDMNWQWSWPETVAVTIDTFGTVLQLMKEYPDFCFSQSQASVYRIVEQYNPDMLQMIRRRVKEGRWEVTASHWVECEKNIVSAESLCRQVLYTRRYMADLFDLRAEDVPIDWACDTFGHAATVPSYLRQAGIPYLYLHRPGTMTRPQPEVFWWEAPDKARVLVRNDSRFAYNGVVRPWMLSRFVEYVSETGLKDMMFVYGVGDHGGGPTRMDLDRAIEMNQWPIYPTICFSTAKRWFDAIAPHARGLPVLRRELNFEFEGCYSSQSVIKKGNRLCEARLGDAELSATLAWAATGDSYPTDKFRDAWRDVLFNQFHDILPGSGVADTRRYANALHQSALATAGQATTAALRRLASVVDTGGKSGDVVQSQSVGMGSGFGTGQGDASAGDPVAKRGLRVSAIFNTTGIDREEVARVTVWDRGGGHMATRAFHAMGPDGKVVRAQVLGSGEYWGHDFVTLAFPVNVPALGCSVYRVLEGDEVDGLKVDEFATGIQARQTGDTHHCGYCIPERACERIENEFIVVTIDPRNGGISGVIDKKTGVDIMDQKSRAGILEFGVERPHRMSSWQVDHLIGDPEGVEVFSIKRTDSGPFIASIEIGGRIRESKFFVTYSVCAGDPRLHVTIKGTWFQRGTAETGVPVMNFVLPLALSGAKARYEIPFGFVNREHNRREEVPALQWAQVDGRAGGRPAGCLLMNDSRHGHSLDGSTLRLTLIRGSYDPDPIPEIGEHEIKLAILPYVGMMPASDAIRHGQAFNHALVAVLTDAHGGEVEAGESWIRTGPRDVTLVAVKKAEDDDVVILRLCNAGAKQAMATVDFGRGMPLRPLRAWGVDLLERPSKQVWKVSGGRITGLVGAKSIANVAVHFQRQRVRAK